MIRSRPCHLASNVHVAIGDNLRAQFHEECPGACISDSKTVPCECDCHGEVTVEQAIEKASERGVPLPGSVAVSAPVAAPADKDRPARRTAPTGRCEHCGAPTGGRFAPGHDAKLKSQLWREAKNGNYKSYAELHLRRWTTAPQDKHIPFETFALGVSFAEEHGYELVERRNAARIASHAA